MKEWSGDLFYHAFGNRSKSQIILVNRNFHGKGIEFIILNERCVCLTFSLEDHLYTVLNCYGPAKAEERDAFLEELNEIITNLDGNNLIVSGDFNMIYNNERGPLEIFKQ